MADLRRAGNPNNKHGHYYVQHEAAADDDPLVQTNFIYQDADFRGGRNPVCPRCSLRDVCRAQVHYRHVPVRRIRKVPRVLFVSFMVQMLLRLGDGGINHAVAPAPTNVHSPIDARRSTRLLVVPMLDLEIRGLLVVRRGGVFKKARTDDPTPPTRRGEATNDRDHCTV